MLKKLLRNLYLYKEIIRPIRSFFDWKKRDFADQSPKIVKQSVLLRNSVEGAIWVETGTFHGGTTMFLAPHCREIYTIEPEPTLFSNARDKFADDARVTVINGASEDVFPTLLPSLRGDINFWLDGHYSAGVTFKGAKDCPVEDELNAIRNNLSHYAKVSILIDDVRCFLPQNEQFGAYPSLDYLVDWARENKFFWHIEHDIFVAKNYR